MRFFTADLHLGDKAIVRWRGFGDDVAAHDAMILQRLNERVGPEDELWLLGDLCTARRALGDGVAPLDALVKRLKARVLLPHEIRHGNDARQAEGSDALLGIVRLPVIDDFVLHTSDETPKWAAVHNGVVLQLSTLPESILRYV